MSAKTAVLTCVYPAALPYLNEFIKSLVQQTDINFDLLVACDGVSSPDFSVPFQMRCKDVSGTPAFIRKELISWAISSGYDALIMADSDDFFPNNRVSVLKRELESGERVLFHDLILSSSKGHVIGSMFGGRFEPGQRISTHELLNFNFLGLTNTALCVDGVLDVLKYIPDDVVAFDWVFFTRLLATNDSTALFIPQTSTNYRQYDGNVAILHKFADKDTLLRSVKVKQEYYEAVSDIGKEYQKLASRYDSLLIRLNESEEFFLSYMAFVNQNAPNNLLWWEAVCLPKTF